ncbi:tyrosine-type recombinase/integrase [Cryobacterium mannosilyticum]|uniref:Integrase n=1 Tax=Cryobacterium mannosilyticum TaxID=1259190 RepID=A0A4V3IDJ5_9MICO|nr:tyrosine-type recombinase/integrase [Cryobacterium mannosilyticum]TFC07168.1 integrase [Cryobacterium mannosilyticum]
MSTLAPTLEKYFTSHLAHSLDASSHTIAAYRDTWRLLLSWLLATGNHRPETIDLRILDSATISAFLGYLEQERGNGVRTRNARLAALHSFFTYAALHHPEHADTLGRVLAIPVKRHSRTDISYLTHEEITALLGAVDCSTRTGRRDRLLILIAISTGMRVSELTALTWADIHLGAGAHLVCHGKGRKDRATPLSREDVAALTNWKTERSPVAEDVVFPTRDGTRMSTDAVAQRLTIHVTTATTLAPTLKTKTITPHVLRHTAAMRLLHAGVDTTVIALWLGHESPETTQIYLHADLAMKEKALERVRPTGVLPGRYAPADSLVAFLEAL